MLNLVTDDTGKSSTREHGLRRANCAKVITGECTLFVHSPGTLCTVHLSLRFLHSGVDLDHGYQHALLLLQFAIENTVMQKHCYLNLYNIECNRIIHCKQWFSELS